MAFRVPEQYRLTDGPMGSSFEKHGLHGMFIIPLRDPTTNSVLKARAMASNSCGWEHVSVSFQTKTPSWDVMCTIKDLFWEAEDCVVQYHPPRSEYSNFHPYCLHLWRPIGQTIPRPPHQLVGPLATETDAKES